MTQKPSPLPASDIVEHRKARASDWFRKVQKNLCNALELLEFSNNSELLDEAEAAKFTHKPWTRGDGSHDEGGGVMAMLHGKVFEKAGCHFSTVHGEFSPEFRAAIPGAEEDPRFWAAGVSFIAHPANPHAPTAHMNTRMIVTTRCWFGGGGDLTPLLPQYRVQEHEDSRAFHDAMKAPCEAHDPDCYQGFKEWCDRYFHLAHRNEPRGIGGIFYDRLDTGDWEADFKFTQAVGEAFTAIYPEIVARRMNQPWDDTDREQQLIQRGRYAEFNLLYDRGTQFGLKTGGNVESILSSLPPLARWP